MSKPRVRYEKVDFIKFTPIGFYDVPKEELPVEEEPEVSEPSTSSVPGMFILITEKEPRRKIWIIVIRQIPLV